IDKPRARELERGVFPAHRRNQRPAGSFGGHPKRRPSMRKLIFIPLVVALAVPAWAAAKSQPSAADHAAAMTQCRAERTAMGTPSFKLLYGTNANRSAAFGKCVSKLAQQNEQNRPNAASQCRAERSADPAAFARSEEHTSELQSPYVISYAV